MYQRFFGLKETPFSLSPDTEYFFSYGHYANAMNTLLVALRTGEGFIKVVGEVGTGKTLLCRKLLRTLNEKYVPIYIPNPQLSPYGLQVAVAEELGIGITRYVHRLLNQVTEKLQTLMADGKRIVLIIDEAQAMPKETLEALRLLTNLETEKAKLIQVVLFGQPELNVSLNDPAVRQLNQRITFHYQLEPMDKRGMDAYIKHRLAVAGFKSAHLFNEDALDIIHDASKGVPRLINILCHKALLVAYGQGKRSVDSHHAMAAIRDTQDSHLKVQKQHIWWWMSASSALFAALASFATYVAVGH